MTTAQIVVFTYAIAARLAYVLYVGIALRREEREGFFSRRFGAVEGSRRFRRMAALIMNNDAIAFIALCGVTRGTMFVPVPAVITLASGALLVIVGLGIKYWAARTLGTDAYYWQNFFVPPAAPAPVTAGPYRFAANPMYTIGYLQTYGLSLMTRSWPGLVLSVLDHVAILVFYYAVEKPHFERLHAPRK